MAKSRGQAKGHMAGHSGSHMPGLKKSMAPMDHNPSGIDSIHG